MFLFVSRFRSARADPSSLHAAVPGGSARPFLLSCCCCCCFRKQPLRYNSVGARIDGLTPPSDYPAAETHYVIAESTGIVKPVQGQAVPMGTPV